MELEFMSRMIDGRMPLDELSVGELLVELEKLGVSVGAFRTKFNREKCMDPSMKNHLVKLLEFQIMHEAYKSMTIGSDAT